MAASDDQVAQARGGGRPPQMTEMRRLLGAMQRQVEIIVRERELTRDMQETMARELAEGKRRGTWLTTLVAIALMVALGGILLLGAVLYHRSVTEPAEPGRPAALPTETVEKTASAVSALIKPGQDRLQTDIREIRNEVNGLDRSYRALSGVIQEMDVTLGDMRTEIDGLKQPVKAAPTAALQPAPATSRLAVPEGSPPATTQPGLARPAPTQSGFDQPGYAPPSPAPSSRVPSAQSTPGLATPGLATPGLATPGLATPGLASLPTATVRPPPPKPTPPRRLIAAQPVTAPSGRPASAVTGSAPASARQSMLRAAREAAVAAAAAVVNGRGRIASPAAPSRPPIDLNPLAYGAPALDDRRLGGNAASNATIGPLSETGFATSEPPPAPRVGIQPRRQTAPTFDSRSPPSTPTTGRPVVGPTIHWTHKSETLSDIAAIHSIPPDRIMRANPNYGLSPGMPCPEDPTRRIENCPLRAGIRIVIPH